MSNAEVPVYDPSEIEPRWQAQWEETGLYRSDVDPARAPSTTR